jgi:hypothetical protein
MQRTYLVGIILTVGLLLGCRSKTGNNETTETEPPSTSEAAKGNSASAGDSSTCNPPDNGSVRDAVPPLAEQASGWCWAASAEMVLEHLQMPAPQCVQASRQFAPNQCCDRSGKMPASPLADACDAGGFPQFKEYGYDAEVTDKEALSWDQVKQQIFCRKQPFVFSWQWVNSNSGHMMVAVEYQTDGPSRRVCRFDPDNDPPDSPYTCMEYEDYVEAAGYYSHWYDYFNFAKIATN